MLNLMFLILLVQFSIYFLFVLENVCAYVIVVLVLYMFIFIFYLFILILQLTNASFQVDSIYNL